MQLDPTARPTAAELHELATLSLTAEERAQATAASELFMQYQGARLVVEEELAQRLRAAILQEDVPRSILIDGNDAEVVTRQGFVDPRDLAVFFERLDALMFGDEAETEAEAEHVHAHTQASPSRGDSERSHIVSEIFRRHILETATELCLRQYTALLSLASVTEGEPEGAEGSGARGAVNTKLHPRAVDGGAPMAIECMVRVLRACFAQLARDETVFAPHANGMLAVLLKLYSGDEKFGTRCQSEPSGDALAGRRLAGHHWTPQVQRLVQPLLRDVLSESGAGAPIYPALVACIAQLPAVPRAPRYSGEIIVPIGRRCLAEVEGIGLALARLSSSSPPGDEADAAPSRRRAPRATSAHSCRTAIVHLAPLLRGRWRNSSSASSATDFAAMMQLCVEFNAVRQLIAPLYHQDPSVCTELLDLFEQCTASFVKARGGSVSTSLDPAIADVAARAGEALLRDLTAFEFVAPLVEILTKEAEKGASLKVFVEQQRAVLRIFRNVARISGDSVRWWGPAGVLAAIVRLAPTSGAGTVSKRASTRGGGGSSRGGGANASLEADVRAVFEALIAAGNRSLLQRLQATPRAVPALRNFGLQLPIFSLDGVEDILAQIDAAAGPRGDASEALALMPSVRAVLGDPHSWIVASAARGGGTAASPASHRIVVAMQFLLRRFWHATSADAPHSALLRTEPPPQPTDVVNEVLAVLRQIVLTPSRAARRGVGSGGVVALIISSGLLGCLLELSGNPPSLRDSPPAALALPSTLGTHVAALETLASCLELGRSHFAAFLADADAAQAFARILQASCGVLHDFKALQDAVPAQGPNATLVQLRYASAALAARQRTFRAMLRTWNGARRDSVLSLVELMVQMLHDDTVYFALKPGVVTGAVAAQTHCALSREEAVAMVESIVRDPVATASGASQEIQSALVRMLRRHGTVAREVQRLAEARAKKGGKRMRSLALKRDPLRTTAIRLLRTLAMLRNEDIERELQRAGVPAALIAGTADLGATGSDLPVVEENKKQWARWSSALEKKAAAIDAAAAGRAAKRASEISEFGDGDGEFGEFSDARDSTAPARRARGGSSTARRGAKAPRRARSTAAAEANEEAALERELDAAGGGGALGAGREARQLEDVFETLGDRIVYVKKVYDGAGQGVRLDRDATVDALVELGGPRVQADLLVPQTAADVDFFAFCSFASVLV